MPESKTSETQPPPSETQLFPPRTRPQEAPVQLWVSVSAPAHTGKAGWVTSRVLSRPSFSKTATHGKTGGGRLSHASLLCFVTFCRAPERRAAATAAQHPPLGSRCLRFTLNAHMPRCGHPRSWLLLLRTHSEGGKKSMQFEFLSPSWVFGKLLWRAIDLLL